MNKEESWTMNELLACNITGDRVKTPMGSGHASNHGLILMQAGRLLISTSHIKDVQIQFRKHTPRIHETDTNNDGCQIKS